jgi:hypothetical protein
MKNYENDFGLYMVRGLWVGKMLNKIYFELIDNLLVVR